MTIYVRILRSLRCDFFPVRGSVLCPPVYQCTTMRVFSWFGVWMLTLLLVEFLKKSLHKFGATFDHFGLSPTLWVLTFPTIPVYALRLELLTPPVTINDRFCIVRCTSMFSSTAQLESLRMDRIIRSFKAT